MIADPLASTRCSCGGAHHWSDYQRKRSYDRLPCGLLHFFAHAEVLRDQGDRVGMRIAAKSAAFMLQDMRQGISLVTGRRS